MANLKNRTKAQDQRERLKMGELAQDWNPARWKTHRWLGVLKNGGLRSFKNLQSNSSWDFWIIKYS